MQKKKPPRSSGRSLEVRRDSEMMVIYHAVKQEIRMMCLHCVGFSWHLLSYFPPPRDVAHYQLLTDTCQQQTHIQAARIDARDWNVKRGSVVKCAVRNAESARWEKLRDFPRFVTNNRNHTSHFKIWNITRSRPKVSGAPLQQRWGECEVTLATWTADASLRWNWLWKLYYFSTEM